MENILFKALIIPEPEDDDETMPDVIQRFIEASDIDDILSNIGNIEFKDIFLNLFDNIRLLSIEKQIFLCLNIIDKIKEIYQFEFPDKIQITNEDELNKIYNFIRFIEFNYDEFFVELFISMNIKLYKIFDIDKYIRENINFILEHIGVIIKNNKIIIDDTFKQLMLYLDKESMINILLKMLIKNLNEISLKERIEYEFKK